MKRKILKRSAPAIAKRMFVKGPAKATRAISFRPSLKLYGSIGTGLAAPKITGDPDKIKINGKAILIIGSM